MTTNTKQIYVLNTKGERKLADIIGKDKTDFYIDCVLDLESARDHQEPAVVSYGGQVFYFDDSDFEALTTGN
jgi:hypothetical protein